MALGSLFTTRKFIISLVINLALSFLIGFAFSSSINSSVYLLDTWNNCSSTYIAYDSREFSENCYYYHGKDVSVNLNLGDSIKVNTEVYQFVNGKTYDKRSLLNPSNIEQGTYSELSNNEIAIPITICKRYNLKIGDTLYVSGTNPYTIKYIFRNFCDIKNPSIYSNSNVVFVGGTEPIKSGYIYAVFGNESNVYNQIYTFRQAKNEFFKTTWMFVAFTCALSIIVQIGIIILFRKQEIKNLYKDCVSGSRRNYYRSLLGVSFILHIMPTVLAFIILVLLGNLISGLAVLATCLVVSLIKIVCMAIKVN